MTLKTRFIDWVIGTPEMAGHTSANFQLPQLPTNSWNDADPSSVSVATTCVKILAETLGKMPLNIYKSDKNGKAKFKTNYLYELLHFHPNKYTTSNTFFQTLEYHRNFKGNSFAKIHRSSGSGKATSFEIINPSRVVGYGLVKNQLYYEVKAPNTDETETINGANMLHFKMMSPNGIWGIDPIKALALNMGITQKGLKSIDSFYKNNALSPKAIKQVVTASGASRAEDAMDTFNSKYTGAANSGTWIELPPNTDIVDLSISLVDAQIIESLKYNSQQIAAMYGVPVYMATGDFTQSKFNSIEQGQLGFKINTVASITKMYRAELESKLLTKADRNNGIEIEFNLNSLVEPDTKTKTEYYSRMAQMGVMTPYTIAELESLPSDAVQKIHLVQTNLMGLEQYQKTPTPTPAPPVKPNK